MPQCLCEVAGAERSSEGLTRQGCSSGFTSFWVIAEGSAPPGCWPGTPSVFCPMGLSLGELRYCSGSPWERKSMYKREVPFFICSLISFCHIVLVRSKSRGPALSRGEGYTMVCISGGKGLWRSYEGLPTTDLLDI